LNKELSGEEVKSVTQKEIAEALGLSKTTVSRAISGKGRIGEETRNKILKYMRDHQANKNGVLPTRLLGVALPADSNINTNHFFAECLYGVCEAAAYMNYNVLVMKVTEGDISEVINAVEGGKIDAVILTRSMENDRAMQYLEKTGFPVGLAGQYAGEDVITVDIDNQGATEALVTMMISKGFRRFALILEEINYVVNRNRYNGFMNALMKSGISEKKQYIYAGKVYDNVMEMVMADILSNKTDCIVCGDDELCVRIMSWLQGEGYRIPRDIAIVSLYNGSALNLMRPSVTAIDTSARSVGTELGKQVCHFLQGERYQKKTLLDYEILIRRSTDK